jgi:hypothetical protein
LPLYYKTKKMALEALSFIKVKVVVITLEWRVHQTL